MGFLTLKLKTLGITAAGFLLSWIVLGLLFNFAFLHALYETVESFFYFQLFISTAEPSEHLIIIDEEENEYDRRTYAELIAGLDRLGAKVIALDVLFVNTREATKDSALVAATRAAADNIIYGMEFTNHENHPVIPEHFHLKVPCKLPSESSIAGVQGVWLPFDGLLKAASHIGHVTQASSIAHSSQGYFPLLVLYNNRLYPALPLLAVMKFIDCRTDTLLKLPLEAIILQHRANEWTIPVERQMQTLINFIDREKFSSKVFSVSEALSNIQSGQQIFKDKIVLIGNSFDSQEQAAAPHFRSYPGLFIHATLISQILNRQNIREGTLESIANSFFLIVAGMAWLFFDAGNYERFKLWQIYIVAFLVLLILAWLGLYWRVKTYVFLPYTVFCLTYAISQFYYVRFLRGMLGSKSRINYLDYYLLIGPKQGKDGTYPLSLVESPAGEGSCELKFPVAETTIFQTRQEMFQKLHLDVAALKEFGGQLFAGLFQPEIRDHYDKSLGIVFSKNAYLRIKLRIDAPELACYPWEYLFDGKQTKEFLALHQNISVTRFVAIPEPVPVVSSKLPLRILVIVPNVLDNLYPPLNVEDEKRWIKDALSKLERRGIVQLQFLKTATLANFSQALKKRVDIIHFIGHGDYSESIGGGLVFENKSGEAELVNIDRFKKLLVGTPLRLVVLNACQTAQTSASDIWIGVAQGLVKIGVPAVVAMQFKIPDESAIEFSKEFYTTLGETFQVDRAISEARRKLFVNLGGGRIDWGIPVLFMRKNDGVIFDIKS